MMQIHLHIIGTLLVILGLIHSIFPSYFKWDTELQPLSLMNRQMMKIHTFFIAFVVFLMGILCLTSAEDLVTTPLGSRICLGLGVFWIVRFFIQLFGYSSLLWKGKQMETTIHLLATIFWAYLSAVFLYIGLW